MKITVDLPENELEEITRLTGISKKGPAIRRLVNDALAKHRRELLGAKFLSGKWSADLSGFESARTADRSTATTLAAQWRE